MTDTKVDHGVPVALLGSASTNTTLMLDVLDTAAARKLVGSLVYLDVKQEDADLRVIGQIARVEMRNRWHEQDTIRSLLKTGRSVEHLSGDQDIRSARLSIGSVFSYQQPDGEPAFWTHDILGTVPPSATRIRRLTQDVLNELVARERTETMVFGTAYGDDDVQLPMYLRHFGSPEEGGQGEAYHTLVVGKTGSGKSTLAKMLLAGYARAADMGILVIDPKGEFADEIRGIHIGDSGFPFRKALNGANRIVRRYGITNIKLETWKIFIEIARALGLHKQLQIRNADSIDAFYEVIEEIAQRRGHRLDAMNDTAVLHDILMEIRGRERIDAPEDDVEFGEAEASAGEISRIYKGKDTGADLKKRINRILTEGAPRLERIWTTLTAMFSDEDDRPSIASIVTQVMTAPAGKKPLTVIDLSLSGNLYDLELLLGAEPDDDDENAFGEAFQKKVIYNIVSSMRRVAERVVADRLENDDRRNVNTLVVFEEAHRFAGRRLAPGDEDGQKLRQKLVESVRETRKFGLGWMFVDQTIGGLDRDIIQQIRVGFFGYGLALGSELESLREIIGGDAEDLELYRSFRDPASYGLGEKRRFPWLAFGPVSPMSSSRPLFFNALSGEGFVEANTIAISETSPAGSEITGKRVMLRGEGDRFRDAAYQRDMDAARNGGIEALGDDVFGEIGVKKAT